MENLTKKISIYNAFKDFFILKLSNSRVNDIKEIEKMAIDVNVDGNITILDLASIAKLQNQK